MSKNKYTWRARLSHALCPECHNRLKSYIGYRNGRRWTSGLFCPNCDYGDRPRGECLAGGPAPDPSVT